MHRNGPFADTDGSLSCRELSPVSFTMFCKIVCGHRVSDLMMEALILLIMQRAPAPFTHMLIVYGPL